MGRDIEFPFGFAEEEVICMGCVKCVHCGKPFGICSTLESELTLEDNNMLPRASGAAPTSGGGSRSQRSGYNYITEADLSTDKQLARVLAVGENPQQVKEGQQRFSDVIVKVAFKGETRLVGMKLNNPNLTILQEAFTQEENKWIDREFYLFLEPQELTGRNFIRVEPVEKKKKT